MCNSDIEMEESVIAKSTGEQEEKDMEPQDAALFRHLSSGKRSLKVRPIIENKPIITKTVKLV